MIRARHIKPYLASTVIVFAVLGVYWNSLGGNYLYDDVAWVTNNTAIRQLWPIWETVSPPDKLGVSGRPVPLITFAINYAIHGLDVRGYHLTNILIHAACGLLLFGVLRRTLRLPKIAGSIRNHADAVAFSCALLWALHPLGTIVVSYISQRSESLMALCYLGTIYCLLRATEGARSWLVGSVLACFAGMASKEAMATAPVVVLLFDRTFLTGSFKRAWQERCAYYLVLGSSWLMLAWLMIGLRSRGVGFDMGMSPWNYAITQFKAVAIYLALPVWPAPLLLDRGQGVFHSLITAVPYILIVLPFVAGAVWLVFKRPILGFGALVFFIILGPSSSVVPIVHQPIGENRVYLPAIALLVPLFGLAWMLIGGRSLIAIGSAVVAFGALTVYHNRAFHTEISVWTDVIAKAPQNPRGYYNLGVAEEREGKIAEAIANYEQTIALDPAYAKAYNNLGAIIYHQNRAGRAIELYERALELTPDFAEAHTNLATALAERGDRKLAIEHYERAVQLAPDLVIPRRLLAQTLLLDNAIDAAAKVLNEALVQFPSDPDLNHTLGIILFQRRDYPAAVQCFEIALANSPASAQVLNNLSAALLAIRKPERAEEMARRALALKPNDPDIYYNLGVALLERDQYEAAMSELKTALGLNPKMTEAQNNLGVCLQKLGRIEEATAAFQAVLKIDPNHLEARNNLAALAASASKTRSQ